MTFIDAMKHIRRISLELSSRQLSKSDLSVLYGIVQEWNMAGRPMYEFDLDYSLMMRLCKISNKAYYSSLKRLQELGLIVYTAGYNQYSFGSVKLMDFACVKLHKHDTSTTQAQPKHDTSTTQAQHTYNRGIEDRGIEDRGIEEKSFRVCVDEKTHTGKNSKKNHSLKEDGSLESNPPVAARPPSFEDVMQAFTDRGIQGETAWQEATKFINYNEGTGWKMNWQNAFENWLIKIPKYNEQSATQQQSSSQDWYTSDEELDRLYASNNEH